MRSGPRSPWDESGPDLITSSLHLKLDQGPTIHAAVGCRIKFLRLDEHQHKDQKDNYSRAKKQYLILVKVRMVVVSCCHGRPHAAPFYLLLLITFVEESQRYSGNYYNQR